MHIKLPELKARKHVCELILGWIYWCQSLRWRETLLSYLLNAAALLNIFRNRSSSRMHQCARRDAPPNLISTAVPMIYRRCAPSVGGSHRIDNRTGQVPAGRPDVAASGTSMCCHCPWWIDGAFGARGPLWP